jgi:enoyl-CoA hydratase/carnithine racemase
MTDKVQVEVKGDVATIMLNKPERLNALDNEMWHGIGDACQAVNAAPDVRVAVLMGAGGCFCAGLDVKAGSTLGALDDMTPAQALARVREHLAGHQASFSAVESLRVPVIAAIQRACMGAGMELALCCDVRLAAEGTLFSIPEVQLGLVPDMGGTQRLPRTVGIGKAKELIYSARRFDAAEAARIGLVNAVYPAGELQSRVAELAAEIAANAPLAVQAAKRAINGTYYGEMRSWLDWETAQASGPLLSEDRKIGLRAAAERKRADFKGR